MNEVSRTLYIPLYGKAFVSERKIILDDKLAERIWAENKIPLGRKSKSKWLAYYMAMRARVFDDWVRLQLQTVEAPVVLHIGCGLDSRIERVAGYQHTWFDIDLSDVILERKKYFHERERYHMLVGDVSKPEEWLKQIPSGHRAVVLMEGIGMYLSPETLQKLFVALSEHFPSVHILMDSYTMLGARLSTIGNPINEVGISKTYGIDDPAILIGTSGLKVVCEHTMTPPSLVIELHKFDRVIFKWLFAGRFARKLYRIYEYAH